jgi:hypothetical protein
VQNISNSGETYVDGSASEGYNDVDCSDGGEANTDDSVIDGDETNTDGRR